MPEVYGSFLPKVSHAKAKKVEPIEFPNKEKHSKQKLNQAIGVLTGMSIDEDGGDKENIEGAIKILLSMRDGVEVGDISSKSTAESALRHIDNLKERSKKDKNLKNALQSFELVGSYTELVGNKIVRVKFTMKDLDKS